MAHYSFCARSRTLGLLFPFSVPLDDSFHLHRWQPGCKCAGFSTAERYVMAVAVLFILKRWPVLNWQPQSPFCRGRRQRERVSTGRAWRPATFDLTQELFPGGRTLGAHRRAGVMANCSVPGFFWQHPEQLLGHQTLFTSSILWTTPHTPACISCHRQSEFVLRAGVGWLCRQTSRRVSRHRVPSTECQKHK